MQGNHYFKSFREEKSGSRVTRSFIFAIGIFAKKKLRASSITFFRTVFQKLNFSPRGARVTNRVPFCSAHFSWHSAALGLAPRAMRTEIFASTFRDWNLNIQKNWIYAFLSLVSPCRKVLWRNRKRGSLNWREPDILGVDLFPFPSFRKKSQENPFYRTLLCAEGI